jgi:cbb3-type cytochrome oxidase subunit 3
MKKYITLFLGIIMVSSLYVVPLATHAQGLKDAFKDDGHLDTVADAGGYDTNEFEVESVVATIIQTALSFIGVVFLILMVYGGYLWMTARGNEEQVTKAKNLITAAIIGTVIVVSAYAITVFVVGKIGSATLKEQQ